MGNIITLVHWGFSSLVTPDQWWNIGALRVPAGSLGLNLFPLPGSHYFAAKFAAGGELSAFEQASPFE
jgi:hypothetical protein